MKKLLAVLFICCAFTVFNVPLYTAYAEEEKQPPVYLRVIDSTTPFFADPLGEELLFYLPYTFYLKQIEEGEILSHVEYGFANSFVLDGYVPKSMLYLESLSVINPYPNGTFTTTAYTKMFNDGTLLDYNRYILSGRTVCVLGTFSTEDNLAYFCEYGGSMGYISKTDMPDFTFTEHPNEKTFIKKENPPTKTDGGLFSMKIIIIVSLILAGIVGLVFALDKMKIKKKPKLNSYYDENDYE